MSNQLIPASYSNNFEGFRNFTPYCRLLLIGENAYRSSASKFIYQTVPLEVSAEMGVKSLRTIPMAELHHTTLVAGKYAGKVISEWKHFMPEGMKKDSKTGLPCIDARRQ